MSARCVRDFAVGQSAEGPDENLRRVAVQVERKFVTEPLHANVVVPVPWHLHCRAARPEVKAMLPPGHMAAQSVASVGPALNVGGLDAAKRSCEAQTLYDDVAPMKVKPVFTTTRPAPVIAYDVIKVTAVVGRERQSTPVTAQTC